MPVILVLAGKVFRYRPVIAAIRAIRLLPFGSRDAKVSALARLVGAVIGQSLSPLIMTVFCGRA